MKRKFVSILFVLFTVAVWGQDQWKNIYSENAWKERDAWQRPGEIIALLRLSKGSTVADIGCHEGYMTMKLAKAVGATGKVYAVDVQQNRLDKLKSNAQANGLANIIATKGDYDNPHLDVNSLDGALIIDTYHEMVDHDAMLQHIKSALKHNGRLVICEPIAEDRRKLQRTEQERRHEVGIEYVIEDLKKAGFTILFKQDPYIDREKIKGDKMWIIVVQK